MISGPELRLTPRSAWVDAARMVESSDESWVVGTPQEPWLSHSTLKLPNEVKLNLDTYTPECITDIDKSSHIGVIDTLHGLLKQLQELPVDFNLYMSNATFNGDLYLNYTDQRSRTLSCGISINEQDFSDQSVQFYTLDQNSIKTAYDSQDLENPDINEEMMLLLRRLAKYLYDDKIVGVEIECEFVGDGGFIRLQPEGEDFEIIRRFLPISAN